MTVAETIKQKAEALPPDQQQEILQFVEFVSARSSAGFQGEKPTLESVKKALAAAAGIWTDRTDLPQDSAEAAEVLRERAMSRVAP